MTDKPEATAEEIETLAGEIKEGRDAIAVPEQLLTEPAPQDEATKSLYMQIRLMTVGQRIKLALKGNREARILLLKDANRLVQRMVLQNPRITEDEVVMLCKNRNTDSDILRVIGDTPEWSKAYQVKLALVQNPKTPLTISMSAVPRLLERDIRLLAKSKNVPASIATRARRLLAEREQSGRR